MAKTNENTKVSVTESVTMDSRKFLSTINSSAQSQIARFEGLVGKLGEKQNKDFALTALHSNKLVFEDVGEGAYYTAAHSKEKGGRIRITDIKRIDIKESDRSETFQESCLGLINAIEESDDRGVESAFRKIQGQRFRPNLIPESGVVKTKDGVIRSIPVTEDSDNPIDGYELADKIVESISDRFEVNGEGIVEGAVIGDSMPDLDLPVSELTTRKIVAKHYKEGAKEMWRDETFQILAEKVAALICNERLEDACKYSGQYLLENQEFGLLNKQEWIDLVENALAVKACFNEDLCSDTATLMYKTNLKANRENLIDAWQKTAQMTDHPVMMENARALAEANDFGQAHEQFLGVIFEVAGEVTIGALISGLELLKNEIGKGGAPDDLTLEEIDKLIMNLKTKGDSDSVWTAMETLDGVRRNLSEIAGLDDFDAMPGPGDSDVDLSDELDDSLAAEGGDGGGGSDKPLKVTIEMDPAQMAQSANSGGGADIDLGDDLGDEELGDEGLGGEEEAGGEDDFLNSLDSMDLEGLGESNDNNEEVIEEDGLSKVELSEFLANEGIDAEEEEGESEGYTLPEGLASEDLKIDANYGIVREDNFSDSDIESWSDSVENDEDPAALQSSAEAWVRNNRSDKVGNITDPKKQQEIVNAMAGKLVAARQAKAAGSVHENQYKSPLTQLSRRGFKKAAVNELVKEGNLKFLTKEDNAALGTFRDVRFTIDNQEEPASLVSADGEVVVAIPEDLVPGALFVSELTDAEAEADAWVEWLDKNIEQLRIDEDEAIDEEIKQLAERKGKKCDKCHKPVNFCDCDGDDDGEECDMNESSGDLPPAGSGLPVDPDSYKKLTPEERKKKEREARQEEVKEGEETDDETLSESEICGTCGKPGGLCDCEGKEDEGEEEGEEENKDD